MVFCCILQCFVAKSVFLQVTLFCREICFCTIYAVLRGEKLSQKLYPWRKMTNMRFACMKISTGKETPLRESCRIDCVSVSLACVIVLARVSVLACGSVLA